MARRVSWVNNSSGHSGTYVYRAANLDPQALPAPVATVDPVAQGAAAEWVDNESLAAGDYDYALQDFDGQGVGALSAVEVYTAPEGYAAAQIGDEIGGGIYAGVDTIGGMDYHIISGDAASETSEKWKLTQTATAGTGSNTDGLANTQAMEAAGIADHPAAQHCVNYAGGGHNDWHMPARSQITLMYNNLRGHAEFATNVSSGNWTWASTEYAPSDGHLRNLSSGAESYAGKNSGGYLVRPVRRVPV